MAGMIPKTSREDSAAAVEDARRFEDHELKARLHKAQLEDLRAQLRAAEDLAEENDRIAENLRVQKERSQEVSKRSIFQDQRSDRQKRFLTTIDDHIIMGMRNTASSAPSIQLALNVIAQGRAETEHYDTFSRLLADELGGLDHDSWQSIAARILALTSDKDTQVIRDYRYTALQGAQSGGDDNEAQVVSDEVHEQYAGFPLETGGAVAQDFSDQHLAAANDDCSHLAVIANSSQLDNEDLDLDMENTSPQEVADLVDCKGNTENGNAETCVQIKCEKSIESALQSAKRCKLTEIEDIEPMQLAFSIDLPEKDTEAALATPTKDVTTALVMEDTISASSPVSRGRTSLVGTEAGGKRSHDDMSVDSQASRATPTSVKKSQKSQDLKKLGANARKFVHRLEESSSNGIGVTQELDCQKCGNFPDDPRLSACCHMYCSKCISKVRKAGKGDGASSCVVCSRDVGKKGTNISVEQIDDWKKIYADGNGSSGAKGAGVDEDMDGEEGDGGDNGKDASLTAKIDSATEMDED